MTLPLERVLVVGLGSIGARHARIVRELLPDATIMALRHRGCDDPLAHVDHCTTRMDEALEFRPQVAVVASPAPFHLGVALRLAEAGTHLLIEKPLSHSCEGVGDLIEVSRNRSVRLMVGYNLRFLPSFERFAALLSEGRCGRVLSVRAEVGQFLPGWRPGTDYRDSVSARAALGGGGLLELSHDLEYLQHLFGPAAWVGATLSKQSDLEIDVEDTVHLVLGFSPAAGRGPIARLDLDFIRHDPARSCTVIGSAGSLRWDAIRGTVEIFEAGSSAWALDFEDRPDRDASYRAEWVDFIRCVQDGGTPRVTGEDGLGVLRTIEAARTSSRERRVVEVAA